jgi:hypothetical protein
MEHRWQYEARDSGESPRELEGLIDEEEEEEWEIARHYHIQVLIEGADVLPITVPIQTIDRPRERVEEVGLQTAEAKSILRKLQRIVVQDRSPTTWFLWHGNVWRADDTLSSLIDEVDGVREEDRDAGRPPLLVLKKLSRALEEFATYIDNNAGAIVNYGERRRCGERISTGFVESTINQLIAKRFVKKQQMRWTPRGAHLLLQVRVHVLNDELRAAFQRWYPNFGSGQKEQLAA